MYHQLSLLVFLYLQLLLVALMKKLGLFIQVCHSHFSFWLNFNLILNYSMIIFYFQVSNLNFLKFLNFLLLLLLKIRQFWTIVDLIKFILQLVQHYHLKYLYHLLIHFYSKQNYWHPNLKMVDFYDDFILRDFPEFLHVRNFQSW